MEIKDCFSAHSEITNNFKTLSCDALSDTIKFYVAQSLLVPKKKNKEKLDKMSHLVLSRLMPKIDSFYKDPKTKGHETDFNWQVIIGEIEPV